MFNTQIFHVTVTIISIQLTNESLHWIRIRIKIICIWYVSMLFYLYNDQSILWTRNTNSTTGYNINGIHNL